MILSAQTLTREGIVITNGKGKPAQTGYDLTILDIKQVPPLGAIVNGKTEVRDYWSLTDTNNEDAANLSYSHAYYDYTRQCQMYYLVRGVYSVTFEQGCKLPNNVCGWIIHRSSIARIGAMVTSGLYDPGFFTDNMGAFLHVNVPQICLGKGERIAQFIASTSEDSELYDGQWQNK